MSTQDNLSVEVVDSSSNPSPQDSELSHESMESSESQASTGGFPNESMGKGDLMDDVSSSSDFNNVVQPAPERFSSVHIRKNLWIPYTGPVVRGKHMVMCEELRKTAFGMDLSGPSITHLKKGSVLPITVEVIHDQSLVEVRAVSAKEVGPLPERRKLVRGRAKHRVVGLTEAWLTPNHCHDRLPLSDGRIKSS